VLSSCDTGDWLAFIAEIEQVIEESKSDLLDSDDCALCVYENLTSKLKSWKAGNCISRKNPGGKAHRHSQGSSWGRVD
jgi:hypothetical protein